MVDLSRRSLLSAAMALGGAAALPPSIARAAAIGPDRRSGTIADVDHVVILCQENRGFDHYFGTLRGVRGFADRFPIPLAPLTPGDPPRTVWQQGDRTAPAGSRIVAPFHLDTRANFDLMRMEGTPHGWPDAQAAWDHGRMAHWPEAKQSRAMGHYRRADLPFQFALAEAFTICDAYHCSTQTGTNTNRLFLWTGTNDPHATHGGPAIANSHDDFPEKGGAADPYRWRTVVEHCQAAGIDWRIYQDMADNFTDNPLVGFERFRAAHAGHGDAVLKERALTTRTPDMLKADVLAGRLPQVSWVIATAAGSEHPGPSSPAQGAAYTAQILDALTADPKVWARTVLLVMFDENDGFFDHMPPPAPPSRAHDGTLLGASSVDTAGEYHLHPAPGDAKVDLPELRGRPYGLGPRVPMYVVSPWSRGGWVNSQVFDHSSVLRFLETRFGFHVPEISPWRRAMCGDLTSAFDFSGSDAAMPSLPDPAADARRAAAIPHQVRPDAPPATGAPWQEPGIRRSRPLPYRLEVTSRPDADGIVLRFAAEGAGAVFHVYDRCVPDAVPRRYSVMAGGWLEDRWAWDAGDGYDLWILGPSGFHRHFAGHRALPAIDLDWTVSDAGLTIDVPRAAASLGLVARRLVPGGGATASVPLGHGRRRWSLDDTLGWYDVTVAAGAAPGFRLRLAGRHDRAGRATVSDPFVSSV